jgi:hypothetical protein
MGFMSIPGRSSQDGGFFDPTMNAALRVRQLTPDSPGVRISPSEVRSVSYRIQDPCSGLATDLTR